MGILKFVAVASILACVTHTIALAQANLVRNRLQKIALGKTEEVRQELPDLLSEFPDDPGVRLLHATLVDDAMRALPLYEKIVRDYPTTEWADDAQWRVVQIFALQRDSLRARAELAKYRKAYPDSEFLIYAVETVKATVGLDRAASVSIPPQTVAITTPTSSKGVQSADDKAAKNAVQPKVTTEGANKIKDPKSSRFGLQVGLYSSQKSAEVERDRFAEKRMLADIIEKPVDGGTKYAVLIGNYLSKESAEKARKTVGKYCNCNPFVVEKQ